MNRIDAKFDNLKQRKEKAMIPFITAGDPDLDTTVELVFAMEDGGADIIELGIPYSDPLADGEIIQQSSARALKSGTKIIKVMEAVESIRKRSNVPIIFLVYYNSIFKYGMERFMRDCSLSGVDGIIIPDLPIEERKENIELADKYGIYLIPLVAPTSKERIQKITDNGKGFVYCVSTNGVTGIRNEINTDIKEYMKLIEQYTDMPKALGFGISNALMAKKYKPYCEGIIVGSAIVKVVGDAKTKEEAVGKVKALVKDLKEA